MSEMFSPERVTVVCKQYGLVPGQAMSRPEESLGLDIPRQAEVCHCVAAMYVFLKIARVQQSHVP